jgi:hypothetical protein
MEGQLEALPPVRDIGLVLQKVGHLSDELHSCLECATHMSFSFACVQVLESSKRQKSTYSSFSAADSFRQNLAMAGDE